MQEGSEDKTGVGQANEDSGKTKKAPSVLLRAFCGLDGTATLLFFFTVFDSKMP